MFQYYALLMSAAFWWVPKLAYLDYWTAACEGYGSQPAMHFCDRSNPLWHIRGC